MLDLLLSWPLISARGDITLLLCGGLRYLSYVFSLLLPADMASVELKISVSPSSLTHPLGMEAVTNLQD